MRVIAKGVTHREGGTVSAIASSLSLTNITVANILRKLRGIAEQPTILDLNPQDCFQVPLAPPGPRGKQGPQGKPGYPGLDFIHDGLDVPLGPPGQRGLTGAAGAAGAAGSDGAAGATGARGPSGAMSPSPLFLNAIEDEQQVGNFPQPNNRPSLPMWNTVINEDGTSLASWTQTSGSWSVVSSAFHIATGATTVRQLRWTSRIAQSAMMFEADVNINSGGGFAADNRVGFTINHSSSISGGSLIVLRSTGALTPASTGVIMIEQPGGTTAGPTGLTNLFSLDTFYKLKVVAIGPVMDIYVDGVFKYSLLHKIDPASPVIEYGYVSLYAYNCNADFKNIKMWTLNPATTITAGGTTYSPVNFNTEIMRQLCAGRLTLASGLPYYSPQQALHSSTDTTAETVTMAAAHGWVTGTIVIPNTTIGGLTANTSYFVNVVNSTTVSFHTTLANAIAGTSKVNLTASVISWFHPTGVGNTSLFFSPYNGNQIGIYNGSYWNIRTFTELTLALGTLSSDKNYDVFIYDSAGNLTLEAVAWSSDTVRVTDIALQDGVYVKSGATTKRYLGTFRTDSTTTTIDAQTKRFVWNLYNRKSVMLRRRDTTATWTLNATSYRQANASASNQVAVVVGVSNDIMLNLSVSVHTLNPGSGGNKGYLSIGEDSTANPVQGLLDASDMGATASLNQSLYTQLFKAVPLGYHFYPWLEACLNTGGNVTFSGSGELETARPVGMLGWFEA